MSSQKIQINGLNISYKSLGSGQPLLILHGWGGSSESYNQLSELLKDKFKLYIPDLPGFGESDPPKSAWDVSNYMKFVNEFTDKIGLEQFFLYGHSFGGRICIKFLNKYPKKVKALILCDSAGIKHPLSGRQKMGRALSSAGKRVFSLPLLNRFEKIAQKLLYRSIGEQDYLKTEGELRESFKKVIEEDLQPLIKNINVPTLIIWGKHDKMTPLSDAYIFKKEIPNSTLKIIDEARHGVHLQAPGKVAEFVKEFLK